MTPTESRRPSAPADAIDDEANLATSVKSGGGEPLNAQDEANGAADPLPSLEDMEDIILEAYNNMQSDGEHIFLPPDVAAKLHHIAQLANNAGYTSDNAVPINSDSNQEELTSLLSSATRQTTPISAATTPPSSPPVSEIVQDELHSEVSLFQLGGNNFSTSRTGRDIGGDRSVDDITLAHSLHLHDGVSHNGIGEFGPALSPVRETPEDLMSVSDLDSVVEPQQETLTPPKSTSSNQEQSKSDSTKKSKLKTPEVYRKVPARPPSVKSQGSAKSPSPPSRTNSSVARVKAEQAPSSSRERSTSSSHDVRREVAQNLKEKKAQRELQARESARKQREDARRQIEEAQQKELAARRERVARMKMQKDQRKGPAKPASSAR